VSLDRVLVALVVLALPACIHDLKRTPPGGADRSGDRPHLLDASPGDGVKADEKVPVPDRDAKPTDTSKPVDGKALCVQKNTTFLSCNSSTTLCNYTLVYTACLSTAASFYVYDGSTLIGGFDVHLNTQTKTGTIKLDVHTIKIEVTSALNSCSGGCQQTTLECVVTVCVN
jgi:hypothetical protein